MRIAPKMLRLALCVCSMLLTLGCQPDWGGPADSGDVSQQPADPTTGLVDAAIGPSDAEPQAPTAPTDAGQATVEPGHPMDASPPTSPPVAEPCDACDPAALCDTHAAKPCRCPDGWLDTVGNGSRCQNVCGEAACDPHATCELQGTRAVCRCPAEYMGDGQTCTARPSCASLACGEHESCETASGVSACVCAKGYARSGSTCVNVDECLPTSPCSAVQVCRDLPGSFECACRTPPNLLADPSFEKQTTSGVTAPWSQGPPWDPEPSNRLVVSDVARTGNKSVRITTKGDWSEIAQRLAVQPATKYRLSAWFKTEAKPGAAVWIGFRNPGVAHSEVGAVSLTMSTGGKFVQLSSTFDSTNWDEAEMYLGINAGSAPPDQVEVDDVRLEQVPDGDNCI